MTQRLRIAACQFPVSRDLAGNARFIRRFMRQAAASAADVAHFPETALPGYAPPDSAPLSDDDWRRLDERTKEIADLAGKLGLWVVLGSCRAAAGREKPANCTHVISADGRIVGTYDKQKLAPGEADCYAPGGGPLVVEINGVRCGFLICHDACFPALFEAYRERGVRLVFHSCHNVSRKPQPLLQELALAQLRTRAADNQMWVSDSNSSARHSFSTACVARPDGSIRSSRRHAAGILLHDFPDAGLGWTYDNRG